MSAWTTHLKPQAIAAIPMGGLPLASAVSSRTMTPMCYVREAKGYGTGRSIEGGVKGGSKILLVDDVITKGTSAFEVLPKLQDYRVQEMLVLIDRDAGGGKRLANCNIKLNSVFQMENLLWFWYTENLIEQGDFHKALDHIQRSHR